MTHWLILPIVLPAMLAAFMVLAARYHLLIQRVVSGGHAGAADAGGWIVLAGL